MCIQGLLLTLNGFSIMDTSCVYFEYIKILCKIFTKYIVAILQVYPKIIIIISICIHYLIIRKSLKLSFTKKKNLKKFIT